jgi:peptide/nickel transport system substrate-binding protein
VGIAREVTRRDLLRRFASVGGMALAVPPLGALVEACGGSTGAAPRAGGTVSMALSIEPAVLNPPIQTLAVESMVSSVIFAGLLRSRDDGTCEGDLAQRYSIDDGGMTYRFRLRPGLRWSDGHPLTSADFLFTYRTYVAPETGTTYLQGWDKIDSVETPDASTVVVRMRELFAPFLLDVATNPVLPEHVLAGAGDIRKAPFNRAPIGAGPFKLHKWETASRIVLVANPHYWRTRTKLDSLVFTIVPDATTQVEQLQAGEVDIISVAQPAQWEQIRTMAPGVVAVAYDDTTYALVQLDQYGALKDVAVRQALDYATPKKDIVSDIMHGLATPAHTDVPPGSAYALGGVEHHDYDLGKARSLLQKAGFRMQGGVMTRDGQPLQVPIYTIPSSPTFMSIAQVLEDCWSRIGVRTSVTTMEAKTLFSDRGPQWNGRDAALIFSWGQGPDPYNFVSWSSTQIPNSENDPGENAERYSNPTVDELVVRGGQLTDFARRKQVYDQLQKILAREVPVIFLYWPSALYAHSARVQGFKPNAFSGVLDRSWTWTKS